MGQVVSGPDTCHSGGLSGSSHDHATVLTWVGNFLLQREGLCARWLHFGTVRESASMARSYDSTSCWVKGCMSEWGCRVRLMGVCLYCLPAGTATWCSHKQMGPSCIVPIRWAAASASALEVCCNQLKHPGRHTAACVCLRNATKYKLNSM